MRKESKKVLREGGCRHDLVRSEDRWVCSKCGHVFVGGNKALGKRVRQSREEAFRGLTRG